ncbi:uncharacterized protein [Diadema antillarum]|uniref:uncharacterized protein n=2 Tax=Diadema antillarum TaxID=105358 RepID=UPI003A88CDE1
MPPPTKCDEVHAMDSVSQASGNSKTSVTSVLMEAAGRKAELMVKLEGLKRRQALEREEQELLRRKEQMEVEIELAAATAKADAMKQFEGPFPRAFNPIPATPVQVHSQTPNPITGSPAEGDSRADVNAASHLTEVQMQQNQLTQLLLECHMKSSLPQRNVQPFDGNPMYFHSFMRAFEHVIESKTTDNSDRLYFLEQYTRGEANEVVRSCMYGDNHQQAFIKAKALLGKKFGNKHQVLDRMMKKAEAWPNVKNEDAEGLQSYTLFVTELSNLAKDLQLEQEINHTQHIKMVISKLPFKLRDKWRYTVDTIQEVHEEPLTFADVVRFVSRQSRIVNNPLYGDITGTPKSGEGRANPSKATPSKPRQSFSTVLKNDERKKCLYCNKDNHHLTDCRIFTKKPHDQKVQFCRMKGLCFACLRGSHFSKDCKERLKCELCQNNHPTVLHRNPAHSDERKSEAQSQVENAESETTQRKERESDTGVQSTRNGEGTRVVENHTCSMTNRGVTMDAQPAIIPVVVRSRATGREVNTYAFIDSGSNGTFCTEALKERLQVKGKSRMIHLQTMTDEKVVRTHVLHDLEICSINGKDDFSLPEVYTRASIPVSKDDIPRKVDLEKWSYLQEVEMPEIDAEVDILIGNNVPKAFEPLRVISSQDGGPFACQSRLGWMVYGCQRHDNRKRQWITSHRAQVKGLDDIQEKLSSLYNTDFTELLSNDKEEISVEDEKFLRDVGKTIRLRDQHYEIGLPFRREIDLPNNRPLAEQRLEHLKRKFQRQPDFHQKYKECMETTIQSRYAEKIGEQELTGTKGKVWYLPHHGVLHPQKGKLRVVYDCSAQYHGASLNHELLKGPDLTNSLFGVLTRFRLGEVAIMADIEAMFSQVLVPRVDRDFLRFLWWKDGDFQQPLIEYRMCVHVFGAISSPSCANYALQRTADEHVKSSFRDVVEIIHRNFYVDDCLYSTDSVEKAIETTEELTKTCQKGGFHLTKWNSNKREVLEQIPAEERAKVVKDFNFEEGGMPTERALGMLWHTEDDAFGFKIQMKERPPTRRGILSTVCALFDPIGCVSPVTLQAKQLLQTLCRLGLGWDEPIPSELLRKWQTWQRELPHLSEFKMPRCLMPGPFRAAKSITLHHFADASEKGYGTVSYIRTVNDQGEVKCSFLMSKARVAPLKQISIPRMELTAATVAVRINRLVKEELGVHVPVDDTYFWTDSMTVLRYIRSETARFKTFVANRIAVIKDGSRVNQWRHVESALNPADLCSRGCRVAPFLNMKLWKEGPDFLHADESMWPAQPENLVMASTDDPELKRKILACDVECDEPCLRETKSTFVTNAKERDETLDPVGRLLSHYSDWTSMRKAVAWMLKLKEMLKMKKRGQRDDTGEATKLTTKDMENAEEAIFRYVQGQAFAPEIATLRGEESKVNGKRNGVKKSSSIYKLDPTLDNGLLRVGGRLSKAALPMEAKHPLILPKGHHVSELILRNIHVNSGHCGRNYILSNLQQRYYMPGANSAVRKMLRRCVMCRRRRGQLMQQKMADLPKDRVMPDKPPFTHVGVDYFGPVEVKRGRSMVKRYGVMFTCLTIRAVHIEKADSLDTDSCIAAIRRFQARRGAIKEMRSDNGTNFVGAERELRQAIESWNLDQLNNALLQRNIQWTFNPPGGSHHGGVWERQIRTVRQLLFSLTKQQVMSDESLQTLFCEVESIINSRPITRVSDDPNDLEALTPNHLLQLKSTPLLPPSVTRQTDIYARRRWRQVQYMADIFWRRWLKEYLPQLQERQRWVCRNRNIQVGDVVLVVDDTLPRNVWPMGRIQRTIPDREGLVRRVEVKTKTGVYLRPISKLCLLLEGDS